MAVAQAILDGTIRSGVDVSLIKKYRIVSRIMSRLRQCQRAVSAVFDDGQSNI